MESKLRSMTLRGSWILSEHDLFNVLTVYVPEPVVFGRGQGSCCRQPTQIVLVRIAVPEHGLGHHQFRWW